MPGGCRQREPENQFPIYIVKQYFPFFAGRLACIGIMVLLLAGSMPETCRAETRAWLTLETKYLVIKCLDHNDLKKFDKQIKFDEKTGFSSFLDSSGTTDAGFEKKLSDKLNALFEKVQLILDMRKPIKVAVQIYPDTTALQDEYFRIYKKKRDLRAWYIFEYNTIYVNVQDLFAGMLAHECAHAIVGNYLNVRPPRATAEILARYVDSHLHKEAKTY